MPGCCGKQHLSGLLRVPASLLPLSDPWPACLSYVRPQAGYFGREYFPVYFFFFRR